MPETQTLDTAVNDAVKEVPAETPAPAPNETTPEPAASETETTEEPKTEDFSLGLDQVEQRQAIQLFAALKDPARAPTVLRFLAEQAGYVENKQQAKEVKEDVMSVLEESLGPEFEIISKRLGPALDKIISKKLAEGQADIRAKIVETEEAKIVSEVDSVNKSLARKYFDADEIPPKIFAAMEKQMEKTNPATGQSVEDYVHDIFSIVAFREGITAVKVVNKSERTERNRTDAPGRLASGRAISPNAGDKVQNTSMTLRQAVEAAAAQVDKELR